MPFVGFSDLVHTIIVWLQNQQYSILVKSNLYDMSNLNYCELGTPKNVVLGTSLIAVLLFSVITCDWRKCKGENLIMFVFI